VGKTRLERLCGLQGSPCLWGGFRGHGACRASNPYQKALWFGGVRTQLKKKKKSERRKRRNVSGRNYPAQETVSPIVGIEFPLLDGSKPPIGSFEASSAAAVIEKSYTFFSYLCTNTSVPSRPVRIRYREPSYCNKKKLAQPSKEIDNQKWQNADVTMLTVQLSLVQPDLPSSAHRPSMCPLWSWKFEEVGAHAAVGATISPVK
jgi:hypothetical protein